MLINSKSFLVAAGRLVNTFVRSINSLGHQDFYQLWRGIHINQSILKLAVSDSPAKAITCTSGIDIVDDPHSSRRPNARNDQYNRDSPYYIKTFPLRAFHPPTKNI
ncbi:MAG: hypothetical protein RQ760_07425 [Sedimentisphaerales bacterium]|nr:hypothetical protein [Sedimentisphaerales bacterium]